MQRSRSWLCPTDADYRRMLDTYRLSHAARVAFLGLYFVLLLAFVPRLGWAPAALLLIPAAHVAVLELRVKRSRRPEYAIAESYVITIGVIAVGVAITGGPSSPVLAIFGAPMLLLSNRFRRQVTWVGLAIGLAFLLGATVAVDPSGFADDPTDVVCAGLLMFGMVALSLPLGDLDKRLRDASGFDALTGLPNRRAFLVDYQELVARCREEGRQVALVLWDLDHFKLINDTYGHDTGDEVLRQVAEALRGGVRHGDLICRLGGEEFAMALPDRSRDDALAVAERQRVAIAALRPAGRPVTISAGVAAATTGLDWADAYRAADEALRSAKRSGRNRVHAAGPHVSLGDGAAR